MTTNTEKTIKTNIGQLSPGSFRRSDQAYCLICQKPVKLLTFSQTAEFFGTDVANIYRLSKKTDLHLLHNRLGVVMICGDSVFEILNRRQMMISNPRIKVRTLSGSNGLNDELPSLR